MHQTAKGHCCITFCEALPEACSSLVTQVTQSVIHSGYHRLEPERLYRSMPCPEVDIERAPTFSLLRPLRFEQHQHPSPPLLVLFEPARTPSGHILFFPLIFLLSIPSLIVGLSRTFLSIRFYSLYPFPRRLCRRRHITASLHHSHHCHFDRVPSLCPMQ